MRVVGDARLDRRRDDERGRAREKQGIAVRRRFGDVVGADHRARARARLYDHRLVEMRLEPLGEHARHGFGGAARGIGIDDLDDAVGILLRETGMGDEQAQGKQSGSQHGWGPPSPPIIWRSGFPG